MLLKMKEEEGAHIKGVKKQNRALEIGINVLIFFLLGLLFVQAGVFLMQYVQRRGEEHETKFDMRMLSATQSVYRALAPELLSPQAIAVSDGETCRAVLNSAAIVQDFYSAVNICLADALQNDPQSVSEEVWQNSLSGSPCVYVKYVSELPYQVVFAFAAADTENDAQIRRADIYIGVREALLWADENGVVSNLLVRGSGGVYAFPLLSAASISDFSVYPLAYPNAFYFCELTNTNMDTALVVTEKITARTVHVSRGIPALLISGDSGSSVFLRMLDFNPDKLYYHMESDGTYVYIEPHGILRSDMKGISYTASEGGGISVSSLNGGEKGSDIYAYLRAASYIVERIASINSQYTGGDGVLRIQSVSASGEEITIRLMTCFENIPVVESGERVTIALTFRGDKLVGMQYRMILVSRTLTDRNTMLQSFCASVLAPQGASDMYLVYRSGMGTGLIAAEWTVVPRNNNEDGDGQVWDGEP